MKFRDFMALASIVTLACYLVPVGASAQSNSPASMTITSSGIVGEVAGVAYNAMQGRITAQIILKNNNNVRVYLQDAQGDPTQNSSLGSGQNWNVVQVDGLPSCGSSYSSCSSNPSNTEINNFSYIDPGGFLTVALEYPASQPANPDTISFALTMMARFARSNIDNSPDDVGSVQEITLAFSQFVFSTGN